MDVAVDGKQRGARLRATTLLLALVVVLMPAGGAEGRSSADCPVTRPNNNMPAPDLLETFGAQLTADYFHGTDRLWVGMWWPNGVIHSRDVHYDPDGSLAVKTPWFRGPDTRGQLVITGRRLDADAPLPRFEGVPSYGGASVEVSGINYRTPGCWKVTGTVGDASLTFVTFVVVDPPFSTSDRATPRATPGAAVTCPVTTPADGDPGLPEYWLFVDRPGTPAPGIELGEDSFYGKGGLWVGLYPNGHLRLSERSDYVNPDGSVGTKVLRFRDEAARGQLTIIGGRLDGAAPPLDASIPSGYGDVGVQATWLTFPTPGCWRVFARSGEASLTFIILVEIVPAPGGTSSAPVRGDA